MKSQYYELQVSLYLKTNIIVQDCMDKLSNFVNYSFNNSQMLSCLHQKKGLKHYSFSGLYPIEEDNIYKSDEIYTFLLRSYNENFINECKNCIENLENDDFITTNVVVKLWLHKDISHVDNLTPSIITLKNGMRWNKEKNTFDEVKNALFNNLIKKYNLLNNTGFKFNYSDIIKDIEVRSKCGIVVNYKNIKMLGYKFRIIFQDNSIAQEIANLSVVEGIGEKNSSFGMGFVKPYFK